MSDFATSFGQLRAAVLAACRAELEWPARVVAGIHATLHFAIANPSKARVLTVDATASSTGEDPHRRMIEDLSVLLAAGAPRDKRLPVSTDTALVSGIATMIGVHIRADRPERLREMAPELVYLTLLPYLGFAEARRWADTAG
jgi:hypothetical protein